MKIALALLLLIVPVFGVPVFAAEQTKAEKDVLAAVENWKAAMLKGDAPALDKIYHPDLAYTHSTGKVENKAEAIEYATKEGSVSKAIEIHELTTHVYGNTATVKGKFDITNGAGSLSHLDILMVFVKSPQGWQLVARQAIKLA